MMDFAIAAVMRDEAPYLIEWLEYHLLVGVQHFFLSSNDCGAAATTVWQLLQPYVQRDLVTLDMHYACAPGAVQGAAYARMHERNGSSAAWTAHIDVDEFIVIANPMSKVRDVFGRLEARGARLVAMPWRVFGSGGHRRRPTGSVLASYTRRAGVGTSFHANSYKSVALRGACLQPTVHSCKLLGTGGPLLDPGNQLWTPEGHLFSSSSHTVPHRAQCIPRKPEADPRSDEGVASSRAGHPPCVLWLSHYRTKSDEEWEAKKKRGQADTGQHLEGAPPKYANVRDDFIVASVLARLTRHPKAERERVARILGVADLVRYTSMMSQVM